MRSGPGRRRLAAKSSHHLTTCDGDSAPPSLMSPAFPLPHCSALLPLFAVPLRSPSPPCWPGPPVSLHSPEASVVFEELPPCYLSSTQRTRHRWVRTLHLLSQSSSSFLAVPLRCHFHCTVTSRSAKCTSHPSLVVLTEHTHTHTFTQKKRHSMVPSHPCLSVWRCLQFLFLQQYAFADPTQA